MRERNQKDTAKVLDLARARTKKGRIVPPQLGPLSKQEGSQLLKYFLNAKDPKELVRSLAPQDYYWIIKKVGEEDCLPLLELGTHEQWQHVMDLEVWDKDRLDLAEAFRWLMRLHKAHPLSLAKWLYTKAQHLAYLFFYKSIDVEIRSGDEAYDLPDGFFTLDGVYYIRAKNPMQQEAIYELLRSMAEVDYDIYQSFLTTLPGVLPAELEEEMFRLRSVRLAEVGFLPFDEAMEVYSPLPPQTIAPEKKGEIVEIGQDEVDIKGLIPVTHLQEAPEENMLMKVLHRERDPVFVERLQLEFAGLCNQILSAEGLRVENFDVLIQTCQRAAAYLNLALEEITGGEISVAEQVVKKHPLLKIFRVGFGLALKAKWEAERWVKESWFKEQGLGFSFWGEEWGEVLAALLEAKPRYFAGRGIGDKDFEKQSELEHAIRVSRYVRSLDALLRKLAGKYPISSEMLEAPEALFYPILFNLWAVTTLGLDHVVRPLALEEAKKFFQGLRQGQKEPPFSMEQFKVAFVEFFISEGEGSGEEAELPTLLSLIWNEFTDEYARVKEEDLDPRYSRIVLIKPSP